MLTALVIIALISLLLNLWLTYLLYQKVQASNYEEKLASLLISKVQEIVATQIKEWRNEINTLFRENRTEISQILSQRLGEIRQKVEDLEIGLRDFSASLFSETRKQAKEISQSLNVQIQREQEQLKEQINHWDKSWSQKFEMLQKMLEVFTQQAEQNLNRIRQTVDEKLQESLENRLTEAFKLVDSQLRQVQEGLGEMRNLASGVGDLRRVLSNVKTRGILGEWQLENLLESILAPEQFEKNVATKPGGNRERVEFAIKLPDKEGKEGKFIYLPIDSKFPQEDYHRLQDAYETGESLVIEENRKKLSASISKAAKDISDKYIAPPYTTDFALLFLPFESLYAEILRIPGLFETIQRDYKVIITGPTTLAAILNSLQLGFRTLAIQKRSSEVWEILKKVKEEFNKFGEVLEKARRKISEADKELETLMTTRTRQLQRQLNAVEKYTPLGDAKGQLLGEQWEV